MPSAGRSSPSGWSWAARAGTCGIASDPDPAGAVPADALARQSGILTVPRLAEVLALFALLVMPLALLRRTRPEVAPTRA